MKLIVLKIFVILLFGLSAFGQKMATYEIDSKFNRITLKKAELKKLLEAIKYYHDNEDWDTSVTKNNQLADISLTLKSKNYTKQITGFDKISSVNVEGEKITGTNLIYYSNFHKVSLIDINLSSYSRELKVKGTDERKVKALSDEISNYLSSNERFLGFIAWDMIFSTLVFTFFIIGQFIFFNIRVIEDNPNSQANVKIIKWVLGVLLVICVIYFVSDYRSQDIFPGFLLVEEDMPWYDRYGNLIGVASTLASLIFTIYKYFRGFFTISFNSSNRAR